MATPDATEIPPRYKIKAPFCLIGNQDFDVFLPIMGADCFTIYAYFVRCHFRDPKLRHTVRGLADATGIGASTVSRSLEVLEHLALVRLTRFGGCKHSECELKDSWVVANRLGAIYHPGTLSYSLSPEDAERLKADVKALREKQQGKSTPTALNGATRHCGNPTLGVPKRNASVSLAMRQRPTRDTQMGTHLLQEERRNGEVPSPTPSHEYEAQKTKSFPDEDEPARLLRWTEIKFTGVMKDMGDYLLDTSRPPGSHFTNGAADWQRFEFNSLAVERAERRGEVLVLVLSASDPAAAWRGLHKYHKRWEASIRKWYGPEVGWELQGSSAQMVGVERERMNRQVGDRGAKSPA
jgi:hypothetical protein